jgi:hypothetical protein
MPIFSRLRGQSVDLLPTLTVSSREVGLSILAVHRTPSTVKDFVCGINLRKRKAAY